MLLNKYQALFQWRFVVFPSGLVVTRVLLRFLFRSLAFVLSLLSTIKRVRVRFRVGVRFRDRVRVKVKPHLLAASRRTS